MNLTPIAVTFVLVAVVFIATGMVAARWIARGAGPGVRGPSPQTPDPGSGAPDAGLLSRVWPAATAEALVLTLLAALWFGSLGHGGWVLLFLLLGALVGCADGWRRTGLPGGPGGVPVRLLVASLLKYLLAGLVCVWRLT